MNKKTRAMIEAARDAGASSVKIGDMEITFPKAATAAPVVIVPDLKAEDILKPLDPFSDMTPEEQLFYATPYYDELQRKKELHAQQLKEAHDG